MPVAGEPLVRRLLRYGARWGIRDFVLNLHYLPETITAHVGDGADLGVRVRYSFESPVLGSAGGPRKALAAAAGGAVFHHQRRHAHQRGSARARREPSRDRRARHHRRHSQRPSRPLRRPDRRFVRPIPQCRAARIARALVSRRRRADGASVGLRATAVERARRKHRRLVQGTRQRESGSRPRVPVRRRFLGRRHAGRLSRRVPVDRQGRGRCACRSGGGRLSNASATVTDSVIWDDVSVGAGRDARPLHRR